MAAPIPTKTVVVTGDVVMHEGFALPSNAPDGLFDDSQAAFTESSPGGAWRMARFVDLALQGGDPRATVVGPIDKREFAGRSIVLWSLEKKEDQDKKKTIWRVQRLIGTKPVPPSPMRPKDDNPSPDLLVIEDLGLGFTETEGAWPAALKTGGNPDRILWHMSASGCASKLWKYLDKPELLDRLTVVVSADVLRHRGAILSRAQSWDLTIEQIVDEFERGAFRGDLAKARRVIVVFDSDGAASFTRLPLYGVPGDPGAGSARFETCLYDPEKLEGAWRAHRPGGSLAIASLVTASLARFELYPETTSLFLSLGRGLAAVRAFHEAGGGPADKFSMKAAEETIAAQLHPEKGEPASAYRTAFPHEILDKKPAYKKKGHESDLLRDLTGAGYEAVLAKAIQVVIYGEKWALAAAPKALYGKYLTVDREEIERINTMRGLIQNYMENNEDKRPLSFAVFGPPGSGKSFAIKELAKDVCAGVDQTRTYNLSQFQGVDDLHRALQTVRDETIADRIPFVFWDEFDTGKLKWLKEFLVPMQDNEFYSNGVSYPLGKAVFVFAGGVSATFQEFRRGQGGVDFTLVKGPDFVSRLRGYINVKGPNPIPPEDYDPRSGGRYDLAFLIRRAILLRSQLGRHASHLIDSRDIASISPRVIRAFLTVKEYLHGARSLESVVSTSSLRHVASFTPSQLPPVDALGMHASADFLEKLLAPQLDAVEIEALAEKCHEAYNAKTGGTEPYKGLDPHYKESNRAAVRFAVLYLQKLGYQLRPATDNVPHVWQLQPMSEEPQIMTAEHDRWLREKLLEGWACTAIKGLKSQRLNVNIVPSDKLDANTKELDILPTRTVLAEIPALGYIFCKKTA